MAPGGSMSNGAIYSTICSQTRCPLKQVRRLLGLPVDYTREDIIAGFRRTAMLAHPDQGGTDEQFGEVMEARDRLLEKSAQPLHAFDDG